MQSPAGFAMKTAIGYVRCSTEKQEREGYSLTQQCKEIEEYCRDHRLLLCAIFREIESAKSVRDRKVFQSAISHLKNNNADVMVFTNWDRFARNTIDNELIRKSLREKYGKQLIATQQKFLTTNDEDDFELEAALQQVGVINELERKKIRRRLVKGRAQKVSQGGWGGAKPPYEYDVIQGELVLNVGRWQIVRKIARMRKWTKMSYQAIADHLNAIGEPGYSGRTTLKKRVRRSLRRSDGTWHYRSVALICENWQTGLRQQWKDYYESKRIERETQASDGQAHRSALLQPDAQRWLVEQAALQGKSHVELLQELLSLQSVQKERNVSSQGGI